MKTKSESFTAADEPVNSVLNKRMSEMTWDEILSLMDTNQSITTTDLHQKFRAISEAAKPKREDDQQA